MLPLPQEKDEAIRALAILLEDMAKYIDYLIDLEENPPKEQPRPTADTVADKALEFMYHG